MTITTLLTASLLNTYLGQSQSPWMLSIFFLLCSAISPLSSNNATYLFRKGVKQRRKFEAVSQAVGVGWKAVVSKNTLKEEWIDENDFNDNYNCITIDDMNLNSPTFF